MRKFARSLYLRNFDFGVEDSLVSTVGVLSGVAVSGLASATVLLIGTIYIAVEAFSMAVGSFLSEESVEEYSTRREVSDRLPLAGALVMFFSYFGAGLIPIVPYAFFERVPALLVSVLGSLLALLLLGYVNGRISGVRPAARALRMAAFGGFAIVVGVLVGQVATGLQ